MILIQVHIFIKKTLNLVPEPYQLGLCREYYFNSYEHIFFTLTLSCHSLLTLTYQRQLTPVVAPFPISSLVLLPSLPTHP